LSRTIIDSRYGEFYGYIYVIGEECKFDWAGECTPDDCNFVYCEHNNKRILTSEESVKK